MRIQRPAFEALVVKDDPGGTEGGEGRGSPCTSSSFESVRFLAALPPTRRLGQQ